MDLSPSLLGLYGLLALVAYQIISRVVRSRAHAAQAKRWGCKPAPEWPGGGFLGLKHLKRAQKADSEQAFPDLLEERFHEMNALTGRVCTTDRDYILGQELFLTVDPKNIQALLTTQFKDFELGPTRRNNMMPTLGDGIFVQDGKAWEHSRALLRPQFVRDQVSDLDLEEQHIQLLLRVMPVKEDGWTAMTDVQALFFRLTIDSATEFLFGESVGAQLKEAGLQPANEKNNFNFALHFDRALLHLAKRFRFGDKYWLHNPKEFQEDNKAINGFIRYYVDIALKKGVEEKKTSSSENERYVFLESLAQQTQDPDELSAQLLNILLAGRDTTASLLSWLFHQLVRNPKVFEELRRTVINTFGTYDNPQDITFASLKGCQYLQFCINETLRLHSIVPGNGRRSIRATTLPRGGGPDGESPVYIPPNTDVNYSVHVMHRRKDLWGEDALEFNPDRWLDRKTGWDFIPFNGGPRICIGQQFALTEAGYVVVRLLQKFDKIETPAEALVGPVRSSLNLTCCPAPSLRLRFREAQELRSPG